MAVVMEHTTEKGVLIRFCDDAYTKQTPEQIERARKEIRDTAWRIQEEKARRRAFEEMAERQAFDSRPEDGRRK